MNIYIGDRCLWHDGLYWLARGCCCGKNWSILFAVSQQYRTGHCSPLHLYIFCIVHYTAVCVCVMASVRAYTHTRLSWHGMASLRSYDSSCCSTWKAWCIWCGNNGNITKTTAWRWSDGNRRERIQKTKKNTYRKGYWAAHGPLQSCFGFDGRSAVTTTHHLTGQLLFILLCAFVCVLAVFHVQNTKNGSYVELWGATSSTPPAISHNDPSIQTRETTINFIVFYSWLVALRCISRFKIRFMMQTMFSFFLFHLVLQIVCAVARNFVFREMTINTFWTATKLTDTMAKLAISILTVSLRGCNSLQKSSFWSSSSSSICMAIYLGFYSIFFLLLHNFLNICYIPFKSEWEMKRRRNQTI